jgi:hypothetical protein
MKEGKIVMPYKVENAEMKRTAKGAPFLSLKIDNKSVSFWHKTDFDLPVKVGDMVECKIDPNGSYWNGSELKIISNGSSPVNSSIPTISNDINYLKGIFDQLKRIADFFYKTN